MGCVDLNTTRCQPSNAMCQLGHGVALDQQIGHALAFNKVLASISLSHKYSFKMGRINAPIWYSRSPIRSPIQSLNLTFAHQFAHQFVYLIYRPPIRSPHSSNLRSPIRKDMQKHSISLTNSLTNLSSTYAPHK